MRMSQVVVVCLSLLVGYIGSTSLNRPSSAQPPPPRPVGVDVSVWRYQTIAPTEGPFSGCLLLTDTVTGHCWIRRGYQGSKWEDYGSPAEGK
jgi:hypothetical protein